MNDKTPDSHLATAAQIQAEPEVPIAHPLNPKSEVYLRRLSVKVGLQREQVCLSRIPPGKESFAYHAHKGDEEWPYITFYQAAAAPLSATRPSRSGLAISWDFRRRRSAIT